MNKQQRKNKITMNILKTKFTISNASISEKHSNNFVLDLKCKILKYMNS